MTAASFPLLPGCQAVLAEWGDALRIQRHIEALHAALESEAQTCVDLAKSLVESVCKTIHTDRNKAFNESLEIGPSVKQTLNLLVLVGDGLEADIRDEIERAVNALMSLSIQIGAIRNKLGFSSHGQDGYKTLLSQFHLRFLAQATDLVVHFLCSAHKGFGGYRSRAKIRYDHESLKTFNEYVNVANETITIFGAGYNPSEVLYYVDHDAYKEYLEEYQSQPGDQG